MIGSALLKQSTIDGEIDAETQTAMPAGRHDGEPRGVGPANEIITRLALAIADEPASTGHPEMALEGGEPRWPYRRSAVLLFVGCGLFWLATCLALVAVA